MKTKRDREENNLKILYQEEYHRKIFEGKQVVWDNWSSKSLSTMTHDNTRNENNCCF